MGKRVLRGSHFTRDVCLQFAKIIAGRFSLLFASPRLTRRLEALFRQQPHRGVGVHRLAEGKALRVFAA